MPGYRLVQRTLRKLAATIDRRELVVDYLYDNALYRSWDCSCLAISGLTAEEINGAVPQMIGVLGVPDRKALAQLVHDATIKRIEPQVSQLRDALRALGGDLHLPDEEDESDLAAFFRRYEARNGRTLVPRDELVAAEKAGTGGS